jgi:hypothetical protein
MPAPFINGVMYNWSQIAIGALGNVFVAVEKISYTDKQEIQNNYGAGNYPIGMGIGKIEVSGSITLFQEELEALVNASIDGRLQSIPNFDITVTFIPQPGQALVNHVIRNVRFMENKRDMSTGDTKVTADISFIASHIDWK